MKMKLDKYGHFEEIRSDEPWLPVKKGMIQHYIEKDIAALVPCLFRHGPPAAGSGEMRYCLSWKRGILRFYVPSTIIMRMPYSVKKAFEKVWKRYPNMVVQIHLTNGDVKYPVNQDAFDDYNGKNV